MWIYELWVLGLYESKRESGRGRVQEWRKVFFTICSRDPQQRELRSKWDLWGNKDPKKPHWLISTTICKSSLWGSILLLRNWDSKGQFSSGFYVDKNQIKIQKSSLWGSSS